MWKTLGYVRLVNDPELRELNSGERKSWVARCVVCVNEFRRASNGENIKQANYFDVEVFDKGAVVFAEHARKGDLVFFECKPRSYRHTDDNGKQTTHVVFRSENFYIVPKNYNVDAMVDNKAEPANAV